jgi:hypothetical protein
MSDQVKTPRPTIGRIVRYTDYYFTYDETGAAVSMYPGPQLPGIIISIVNTDTVCLCVFTPTGPQIRNDIRLSMTAHPGQEPNTWHWPRVDVP